MTTYTTSSKCTEPIFLYYDFGSLYPYQDSLDSLSYSSPTDRSVGLQNKRKPSRLQKRSFLVTSDFQPQPDHWEVLRPPLPCLINFVDFKTAFESVHRPSLWEILKIYGMPTKIVNIVKNSFQNTTCSVRSEGSLSSWFNTRPPKGGCCNPLRFLNSVLCPSNCAKRLYVIVFTPITYLLMFMR